MISKIQKIPVNLLIFSKIAGPEPEAILKKELKNTYIKKHGLRGCFGF